MVFQIAWIPLPITITRNEEEFEEEFDDDDFEMIQNIVEDQIQYNSEITAQPIIWREIDQAEESVTDDDDDDSLSHLIISHEQKELNNFVVKNGNNVSMDLFGNSDPNWRIQISIRIWPTKFNLNKILFQCSLFYIQWKLVYSNSQLEVCLV